MADDRLTQLGRRWGLVGFAMQLYYLLYVFVDQANYEIKDLFKENLDSIELRFGQLKPPMFKFPDAEWMVWFYVSALVVCLVVVWSLALRSLFRDRAG